jgi:hypothetical protein
MMLPTHALAGLLLAAPLLVIAPELAGIGLLSGLLGGVWPDLDLYTGHRKTLHYPVYYSLLAAVAVPVAVFFGTVPTVAVACFFSAAALHSVADVFGGGLELRPWEGTSDRAVYSHYHGRWIAPLRLVRYDGAPEDLLLSMAIALPLFVVLHGGFEFLLVGMLAIAVAYTLVRRILPQLAEVLVQFVPAPILPYLPDRYRTKE